jgi:hypothetical protein
LVPRRCRWLAFRSCNPSGEAEGNCRLKSGRRWQRRKSYAGPRARVLNQHHQQHRHPLAEPRRGVACRHREEPGSLLLKRRAGPGSRLPIHRPLRRSKRHRLARGRSARFQQHIEQNWPRPQKHAGPGSRHKPSSTMHSGSGRYALGQPAMLGTRGLPRHGYPDADHHNDENRCPCQRKDSNAIRR